MVVDDGDDVDSVAKLKAAQDLILINGVDGADDNTNKTALLYVARDAWVSLAKDTVMKMKAWVVDEDVSADNTTAWTNVGTADNCAGTDY